MVDEETVDQVLDQLDFTFQSMRSEDVRASLSNFQDVLNSSELTFGQGSNHSNHNSSKSSITSSTKHHERENSVAIDLNEAIEEELENEEGTYSDNSADQPPKQPRVPKTTQHIDPK